MKNYEKIAHITTVSVQIAACIAMCLDKMEAAIYIMLQAILLQLVLGNRKERYAQTIPRLCELFPTNFARDCRKAVYWAFGQKRKKFLLFCP